MKYEDRTTVTLPNLLLRKHNYSYNEILTYPLYILHKVEVIFPLLLHHQTQLFSPSLKTFYVGRVKLFTQASEPLCFSKSSSA